MPVRYLFSLLILMSAGNVQAFPQQKLTFANETNKAMPVEFVFSGAKLSPSLDLLAQGVVKDTELRPIQQFLQRMYKVNNEGGREDILAIWNPDERAGVKAEMTDELFNANRERFKAIAGMRLKMVMEYGSFYINFVEVDFGSSKMVMKFPLTRVNGELYLTNRLNGDYFYDAISHFLDPSNYQVPPAQQ